MTSKFKPWDDADEAWRAPPLDLLGVPRAIIRFVVLLGSLLLCIFPYMLLRYGQRPFDKRHLELPILRFWGGIAVWCFGLKVHIEGRVKIKGGLITSNHCNFIDIPLIFRVVPVYFMAKSEIKRWFFIGWCARVLGTEFIIRDPQKTNEQVVSLARRVKNGDRMLLFPEATTTDGQRIIPFRSSMFQAIADIGGEAMVQPISIYYHAPKGASVNFFGYWGDANLATQMLWTLANKGRKRVDVKIGEPLPGGMDRKTLSQKAEDETRDNFTKLKDAAPKPA